jgi:uncharacterized tellurite resistance protein B-like protein
MVSFTSIITKIVELVVGHSEVAEASLLFDRRGDPVSVPARDAVAMLMVWVALADGFIAREEIQTIVLTLQSEFGVSVETAKLLLERVTTDPDVPPIEQVTELVAASFDAEQRAQICALLERVAQAEGGVHREERRLVSRVQQLLSL